MNVDLLEKRRGELRLRLVDGLEQSIQGDLPGAWCGCKWDPDDETVYLKEELTELDLTLPRISLRSLADCRQSATAFSIRIAEERRCKYHSQSDIVNGFKDLLEPVDSFEGLCIDCVRADRDSWGEGCRIKH